MNRMLLVLLLLLSQELYAAKVGYGYADSVLPSKNQELFWRGFELGAREKIGSRFDELIVHLNSKDGSKAGALRVANSLIEQDVVALVGFPTSHEALQVAPIASSKKILSIYASAGHSKLGELGPLVYTTGESMNGYAQSLIQFLAKRFPQKTALFVYDPKAVFTVNQKEVIEKLISQDTNAPKIEFRALDSNGYLDEKTQEQMKAGRYQVTVLATYPDDSLGALQSLRKVNVDLPVIANSSWTTGDVALIQSTLSKFKSDIFCAALWIPGSKNSIRFEKIYREKFNTFPTAEAASGFDLGVIVGQAVLRVKGDLTKESFAEAFSKESCFDGTTKGQFCFPKSGGFSDKKVEFVKYSNNRFVEIK